MLTSKERAGLTGLANKMVPIFQVGKSSLTPELTKALDDALEARELIKVSVLKNCADDPRELAEMLAERTHAEVVRVIGKKMILYRESRDVKKEHIITKVR